MMNLIEKLRVFISQFKIMPSEKSFQQRAPELVKEVLELTCHLNIPFRARISLILNGLNQPPKCNCGKEKIWSSTGRDWKFCSPSCVNNSPEVQEKKKKTCRKNYGVDNPSESPEVQKRIGDTLEKNYGVRYTLQSPELKNRAQNTLFQNYGVSSAMQSPELKKKYEETCFQNYGVRNPNQSEIIKSRIRRTCKDRYGIPHPQTSLTRSKALNTQLKNRYGKETLEKILSKNFWEVEYLQKQKSIDRIAWELKLHPQSAMKYFGKTGLELRTENTSSSEEREIKEYLETLLGNVSSFRLGGNRSVDFYIPKFNLAFEYNGVYWHSENFRSKNYHLEKTLECEQLGIRLIHIWSDDWNLKKDLMKRKIKSLLNLESEKIFARKCKIDIPSQEQKRDFYNQNHIKGDGGGSISYALYFQDQPRAMITFKNMRDGVWDLNRFATSCNVPGGFSKLLEHFKRNNDWKKIYTFADRSWSQGNVYLKTGFSLVGEQGPTFFGIEHNYRRNRLNYTLKQLKKRFPELNGTQFEIMDQAKIKRIWDCGQLKFELNNPS